MVPVETALKPLNGVKVGAQSRTPFFHVLTAVATGKQRFWTLFLPVNKGFGSCFYQRTKVLTAISTGALGYGCQLEFSRDIPTGTQGFRALSLPLAS